MYSNYLTIGQLAKLTDTQVKALRYYETIGLLTPALINQQNGYRYYTLSHVTFVQIIKLCTQHHVPLKELTRFMTENQKGVNLAKLVSYATSLIEAKLAETQSQLAFLNHLQDEIDQAKHIHQYQVAHFVPKTTTYYLTPFDDIILTQNYFATIQKQRERLLEKGIKILTEQGLYYQKVDGQVQRFIAIEIALNEYTQNELTITLSPKRVHIEHLLVEQLAKRIETLFNKRECSSVLIKETFDDILLFNQRHLALIYEEIDKNISD